MTEANRVHLPGNRLAARGFSSLVVYFREQYCMPTANTDADMGGCFSCSWDLFLHNIKARLVTWITKWGSKPAAFKGRRKAGVWRCIMEPTQCDLGSGLP